MSVDEKVQSEKAEVGELKTPPFPPVQFTELAEPPNEPDNETKPVDAHRDCDNPKCKGKVVLWYKGEDVLRVTGRKDKYGEVEDFICNTCRFDKKQTSDWTIEGPRQIEDTSVISSNHYEMAHPLPVVEKNPELMEANKKMFTKNRK